MEGRLQLFPVIPAHTHIPDFRDAGLEMGGVLAPS